MSDDDPKAVEQFYGILAFIPEGSDFNFDEAVSRCQRTFPRRKVQTAEQGKNKAILIVAKRWEVLAVLVDQPHVAEESREMAGWHREHPQAS
jgi:hypothetical protein